jgi:uncharacterized membrane protein
MIASAIAMIYAPSALARPWPLVLTSGLVRAILYIAGVTPSLFVNPWPFYGPLMHARLLELWFVVSAVYFAAGFLMLAANYRRLQDPRQKRRVGALCIVFAMFGFIVLHNVVTRGWISWFGSAPPALFSGVTMAAEALLFPIVPLTLAWCVVTCPGGSDEETRSATANG